MLNGPGGAQPSQNAQALARRMTQMPQMAPALPPRPTQGLDIAGLLQQVQALVQPGPLGMQVDAAWGDHAGSGAVVGGKAGQGQSGLPPLEAHMQLANMKPAQMLHTLGRAKMVAHTMQHLRMIRQAPQQGYTA